MPGMLCHLGVGMAAPRMVLRGDDCGLARVPLLYIAEAGDEGGPRAAHPVCLSGGVTTDTASSSFLAGR